MAKPPEESESQEKPRSPKPLPRKTSPVPKTSAHDERVSDELPPAPPRAPKQKAGSGSKSKSDKKAADEHHAIKPPTLETYESRQRIRLVVGTMLTLALVLLLLIVLKPFRSSGPQLTEDGQYPENAAEAGAEAPGSAAPAPAALTIDQEAQAALADARRYGEHQQVDQVLRRLEKIAEDYPDTPAAKEAQAALKRAERGLPLFVDEKMVEAQPPPAAASENPTPSAEIIAAPAPEPPPPGPAFVTVAPPPVPPEPRAITGLTQPTGASGPPKAIPNGFRTRPEAGIHPAGWPLEITCDQDGASMVFIPGGAFTMGRDGGPIEERPAHRVVLSPYYIDQHEVTVGQFMLFLRATGRPDPSGDIAAADPQTPIVRIPAQDAYDYARWAGKSLLTEAQWEMAGRTIDGRNHPWGAGDPQWDSPRKPGQIDPVMQHPLDLSPYGVFDLAGNAREWTSDYFDPRYFEKFRREDAVDPMGPGPGQSRNPTLAVKGGSDLWNLSSREGMRPDSRLRDLGFRCALNLTAPQRPAQSATPGGNPPAQPGSPVFVPF